MFWFMCKTFYLILISILSSLALMMFQDTIVFHIDLNSFVELSLSTTFVIDKISLIFISTVSTVSSMIVLYSFFYLKGESPYSISKFLLILMLFIISMLILSVSANLFWLMIGWDGLGISSFCLIIFYQNWKSFGSGMVTFLSNRLGDTLMIISMVLILLSKSPNAWMFPGMISLLSILIAIGAYSKSAQLPYLFWLPQAMAAPTPVSALVHSSTLVTAGIYIFCRFQPISNFFLMMFFFSISCATVLIAGTSSLMEFDLKKIIALSTLCHVSLMMMFSVMKEVEMSLFHLMTHAFFKSLLFMVAGLIIHTSMNSQDIRFISISKMDISISFPFFMSILSMMGFPFLSGFYSKETLLMKSLFDLPSTLMIIMFLLNSLFSCAYSIRLAIFLFSKSSMKLSHWTFSPMSSILIVSSLFSSFVGGVMMPFIIPEENEVIQSSMIKSFLLVFSFTGMLIGVLISTNINTKLVNSLSELWKSNFIYKVTQKHFFLSSSRVMWMMDEKGIFKMLQQKIFTNYNKMSYLIYKLTLNEPFLMIKFFHMCGIATFFII
uniref:NADH dehydrogenase subunit 5 n=1 Tax=Brueelia nebulosa TaxID=2972756 RepID=UPI0023AB39D3|nr:NADH dehydrogenase subunit 5 [Brueelia nebulosa]WCF77118.1 NADH dehydrogenase subunit 5 [Brueelia nebulosa]